jgi:hypothetical protein
MMLPRILTIALFSIFCTTNAFCAGSDSQYLSLPQDVQVSGIQTLLSAQVNGGQWVYFQSAGRYWPSTANTGSSVYITVDGIRVGTSSVINCWDSVIQHSFEVVGASNLSPGSHQVQLVANFPSGGYVGSSSNLIIMTRPAARVSQSSMATDSNVISVNTDGIYEGTPLPFVSVLTSTTYSDGSPIIALASGRSYYSPGHAGDALWNLSLDGVGEHNDSSSWSDDNIVVGAEFQAPMYNIGFFSNTAVGNHTVSLNATKAPYPPVNDRVTYRVGSTTTLVTLNGGFTVYGKIAPDNQVYHRYTWTPCVGSSSGWPGCPNVGSDVVLYSTVITIPPSHNGVVMFSSNPRVQGGPDDQGGIVRLWITVDGQLKSSVGVQQISNGLGAASRTLASSYLAAGAGALSPGTHTVQLHARADGDFVHLVLGKDLPFIWFD